MNSSTSTISFEFDERVAKEIMVPRTDMVTVPIEATYMEVLETITTGHHTRYPVVDGDKDNIRGFINVKEFLTANPQRLNTEAFHIEPFIKPIIHVIENTPIHDLLVKMQKERTHIAVLMDEYGGTSGLVTVEDILEEIVGEIRDEFDVDEVPEIRKLGNHHFIINTRLRIEDVNKLLETDLPEEEFDTVGGWFLSQSIEADAAKEIEYGGYRFKIYDQEGHQIYHLEVQKLH